MAPDLAVFFDEILIVIFYNEFLYQPLNSQPSIRYSQIIQSQVQANNSSQKPQKVAKK